METAADFLLNIPLFNELSEEEREFASRYVGMIDVELAFNPYVFKEGDPGDYVCFVVAGKLDVIKEPLTGRPVVLTTLRQGDSIGEMSIIDSLTRSASVKATEDSRLMVLSRRDFELMMAEFPQVGIKVLRGLTRMLSMNLRRATNQVADNVLAY